MTDVGRPIPSFVHQRNRLTAGQQRAWDRWWPVLGHEVDALVSGAEPFDPAVWFGRTAPVVLEIGSGMGESMVAMAAAAPDVDHLAVEVFEPGLATLLMRIAEAGLSNIVPVRGDAVALLRERVPPGSLDGIRMFFPDPWPKRKHHKRRLIQPGFVTHGGVSPSAWRNAASGHRLGALRAPDARGLRRRADAGEHRWSASRRLAPAAAVAADHQVRAPRSSRGT